MSFITRSGSEFRQDGKKFRFIGFNYYPFIVSISPRSSMQGLFDAAKANNVTVFRTWCFDTGNPPNDSNGNFRYLDYPIGDNVLSNGSFETDTSGWILGKDYTYTHQDAYEGTYSIKQVSAIGYSKLETDEKGISVEANTNYVLTFRYKVHNPGGNPPVLFIKGTSSDGTIIKDAGYNSNTNGIWKRKQVLFNSGIHTTIFIQFINWNGSVTAYYDDINLSVRGTPQLVWREETFKQLDMLLEEAGKRGIKLILSLSDNPTYYTKKTYVDWANTLYNANLPSTFPYIGFFTSIYCKELFKDFIRELTSRYKNREEILAWELGNELRLDRNDTSGVNSLSSNNLAIMSKPGGWIDEMSTYIKSLDPNHLVSMGGMSHRWKWVQGDTVANGSYYGIDYELISALPNIDYLDFHLYPTQGAGEVNLLKYGQHLGFADKRTGTGLRAQIQDYIRVAKKNNKPVVCGEIGFVREVIASNNDYPLYPRYKVFKKFFEDFFDAGGDGVLLWHATVLGGGSYSIGLASTGGASIEDNSDDTKIMSLVAQRNYQIKGERIPVSAVEGISI